MELLIAGLLVLMCYMVMVWQFYTTSKKGCKSIADIAVHSHCLRLLNRRHIICLAALGITIAYAGFLNFDWLLLHAIRGTGPVVLTITTGVAALVVSLIAAQKDLRKSRPVQRVDGSSENYLLLRSLYIIGCELFYRGVLFHFFLLFFSVPVAVGLNLVLYAVAHAFNTRQEFWGTVPFGILLYLITIYTGSIWPAVVIHLLLAVPYDSVILLSPKLTAKTSIS